MSDAGSSVAADVPQLAHRQLIELIGGKVRVRFALTAAAFADRLLQQANADTVGAQRALRDRVSRLSLDDLYLAWACACGEKAAWQELGTTHFGFIRTFARRYLPGHAAADVADEVIADLWERGKLERYQGRSTLRTWLGALVGNAALNAVKALQRGQTVREARHMLAASGQAAAVADLIAEQEVTELMRGIVTDVLKTLPRETKLLLQLYYEQGLTLEEMSGPLRISTAALSRRLKQTRDDLRTSIEAQARRTAGIPARLLRDGIDLAKLDVDLGVLLGETADG